MSRYIDVKVATNVIGSIDTTKAYDDKDDIVEKAIALLDHLPTADVVEVVRCKDCKHSYIIDTGKCYCRNAETPWYNDYFEIFTEKNDYCSYGERSENGT